MFTRSTPPLRIIAATEFANHAEASRAEYRMKQLSVAGKLEVAASWPLQTLLPMVATVVMGPVFVV
jgi:predicted GIY-YIG superfamily endonuclease